MFLRLAARAVIEELQEVETQEDGIAMDFDVLTQTPAAVPTTRDLPRKTVRDLQVTYLKLNP